MDPNDLIGTKIAAPRQNEMALASWQSWDYYNGNPYPAHAFGPKQWPRDKGPLPTALPLCEEIINEGSEFVFRNGAPTFSVPDDPDADALIQDVIRWNRLGELWVPTAIAAANQGALAAKLSVDLDDAECPVRVTFLDVPQECRVWVDPHDRTRILMARVQYPYRDLSDGEWYYYREEWTADLYAVYEPKPAGQAQIANPMLLPGYTVHLGDEGDWHIARLEDNPFGLVPFTVIRNRAVKGNPLGTGDCWRVFRIVDRIALTMHGEDRANQLHSEPIPVVTNAEIDNEGPLIPGEPISVRNEDREGAPADFKLVEPTGRARVMTQWDIDEWKDHVYRAVGLSRVDPAEVTNKGNMTALAFAMTYARTIATSDLKRELWGRSGMCVFFRNMLVALNRLGGVKEAAKVTESTEVSVEWPPYFEQTDQDKADLTDRTSKQVAVGFLPLERGAERVARAEKIPANEIEDLLKELKARRETVAPKSKGDATDNDALEGQMPPSDLAETANVHSATGVNNFTA